MRESVRERYEVGRTIEEQLADAVHAENYELAAALRDRMLHLPTEEKVSPPAPPADALDAPPGTPPEGGSDAKESSLSKPPRRRDG